jgi:hypothetical protein
MGEKLDALYLSSVSADIKISGSRTLPAWKQRNEDMNVSRMENNDAQRLTDEYCFRFGQIAVEKGFITKEQLKQALSEQVDDDVANRRHRLIGTILFEKDWITPQQIDTVLNAMSRNNRIPS